MQKWFHILVRCRPIGVLRRNRIIQRSGLAVFGLKKKPAASCFSCDDLTVMEWRDFNTCATLWTCAASVCSARGGGFVTTARCIINTVFPQMYHHSWQITRACHQEHYNPRRTSEVHMYREREHKFSLFATVEASGVKGSGVSLRG